MKRIEKPFTVDFNIMYSSIVFWCYVYCVFVLFLELISLSVYIGMLLLSTMICTYVFLWYIALPQPDSALATEVLGSNPKLMQFRKSSTEPFLTSLNNTSLDEEKLDDDKIFLTVIGHRGAGLDAPENSLSAFKQCHEKSCRMVEFDLVMTADDVPVLFHDETVDRLTNTTGLVQQMTWDQLKTLDISEKHPLQERYVGETVALFGDAVDMCLELGLRMIIDVKEENTKVVQVILDTFKERPEMYKRAMVSSFNPVIIYMVRSSEPRVVCSLAWRSHYYSYSTYGRDTTVTCRYSSLPVHLAACVADIASSWLLHNVGYYVLGLSAILLHKDVITSEVIDQWEKKNIRVIAWTVNRPQEKLFFSRVLKVAYITDTLVSEY